MISSARQKAASSRFTSIPLGEPQDAEPSAEAPVQRRSLQSMAVARRGRRSGVQSAYRRWLEAYVRAPSYACGSKMSAHARPPAWRDRRLRRCAPWCGPTPSRASVGVATNMSSSICSPVWQPFWGVPAVNAETLSSDEGLEVRSRAWHKNAFAKQSKTRRRRLIGLRGGFHQRIQRPPLLTYAHVRSPCQSTSLLPPTHCA